MCNSTGIDMYTLPVQMTARCWSLCNRRNGPEYPWCHYFYMNLLTQSRRHVKSIWHSTPCTGPTQMQLTYPTTNGIPCSSNSHLDYLSKQIRFVSTTHALAFPLLYFSCCFVSEACCGFAQARSAALYHGQEAYCWHHPAAVLVAGVLFLLMAFPD